MKCPNCHNDISVNAKYCGLCGSPVKPQETNESGLKQSVHIGRPPATIRLAGFLVFVDVFLEYLKLFLVTRPYRDWSYRNIKVWPNEFIYENYFSITTTILFSLLFIGFIGFFLLKGKNWPRVSFLIVVPFCLFRFLIYYDELFEFIEGFLLLSTIQTISYLTIIYLLFIKDSREWYKYMKNKSFKT